MERRNVIGGGLAGLLGVVGAPEAGAEAAQGSGAAETQALRELTDELKGIRAELRQMNVGCDTGVCGEVSEIRRTIVQFVRTRGRFPQLIDVGSSVWFRLYDWHVRNRQTVNVTRMPDGRYALQFMYTRLVLHAENIESYIGVAYDPDEGE